MKIFLLITSARRETKENSSPDVRDLFHFHFSVTRDRLNGNAIRLLGIRKPGNINNKSLNVARAAPAIFSLVFRSSRKQRVMQNPQHLSMKPPPPLDHGRAGTIRREIFNLAQPSDSYRAAR